VEPEFAVDDAAANRVNALAVDEEMIVGQVDRAITLIVQFLEFAQDVLRRAAPPTALAQEGMSQ